MDAARTTWLDPLLCEALLSRISEEKLGRGHLESVGGGGSVAGSAAWLMRARIHGVVLDMRLA